jgi:hypothetical protein
MSGERPSDPPVSVARFLGERIVSDQLPSEEATVAGRSMRAGLRCYRDEALLDRVRNRLEVSARRPPRAPAVWRAAAALALFGIGVGVGLGLPSLGGNPVRPEVARVTAETARAGAAEATRARPVERRDALVRPPQRRAQKKHVLPPPVVEAAALVPLDAGGRDLVGPADLAGPEAAAPGLPAPRWDWLELADAGDYAGAWNEFERSQAAHLVLATGTVEELMTMAEVARFAGNQERAIQALSQVVDRYAGDPNAPLAAMMLGNLLSRSGDSAGAARAFALNRTLSPGGDFAEDSLVREFDLALAAGDATLAAGLFDQYAREFPAGPRIYAMRYELDELIAQKDAAQKDAERKTPELQPTPPDPEPPASDAARSDDRSEGAAPTDDEKN